MKIKILLLLLLISATVPAQKPELVAQQDGHHAEVYQVYFSPDERQALSADKANRIVLWDLAGGKFVRFIPVDQALHFLCFSPNGQEVITILTDNSLNVWSLASGERVYRHQLPGDSLVTAQLSPDRNSLIACYKDHTLLCWDVQNGRLRWQKTLAGKMPGLLYFSSDGATVSVRSADGTALAALKTESGTAAATTLKPMEPISDVKIFKATKALSTANRTLQLFDFQNNIEKNLPQLAQAIEQGRLPVSDFCFSKNGNIAVIALGTPTSFLSVTPGRPANRSGAGALLAWDAQNDRLLHSMPDIPEIINALDLSADGSRCLSASSDQTVRLWDVQSGEELLRMKRQIPMETNFRFTPDFQQVGMVNYRGVFKSWDLDQRNDLNIDPAQYDKTATNSAPAIDAFALFPDGKRMVSASRNFSLDLWDLKPLVHRTKLKDRHQCLWVATALDISPDGKKVLVGSSEEWRVMSYVTSEYPLNEIRRFLTNSNRDTIGVVTDNGEWYGQVSIRNGIVSLEGDYFSVSLWDLEKKQTERMFSTGSTPGWHPISAVRFSADGKFAIADVLDKTMAWDLRTDARLVNTMGMDVFDAACFEAPTPQAATIDTSGAFITVWNLFDGKIGPRISSSSRLIAAGFQADGKKFCALAENGTLTEWDAQTGAVLRKISGLSAAQSIDYAPDANFVLLQGKGTVAVWNLVTGAQTLALGFGATGYVGDLFYEGHLPAQISQFEFLPDGWSAISTSYDGTIRYWNFSTGAEICSIYFPGEKDWVVTTPSGLFDASQGALDLLYFRVGTEVIELEQLKERYYEPGLLQKLLGFSNEPLRSVEGLDYLALYPAVDLQLDTAKNYLWIRLQPREGGVGKVSVFVNGKEVLEEANPPQGLNKIRATEISVELDQYAQYFLLENLNTVSVRAYNEAGWLKSAAKSVRYRPVFARSKGSNNQPSNSNIQSLGQKPALHVLVVGTADYAGTALDLKYSGKDAGDMAGALQQVGAQLFGADNVFVRLLSTDASAANQQPTRANIKAAFEQITGSSKAEDVLVVYFSGHGVSYGDADQALFYYLTMDIASENLSDAGVRTSRTISSAELTNWLKIIPAQKQVLILDACNSGRVVDNITAGRKALSSSQVRALDRMKDRTGMYVLTGSAADMVSYEAGQYGQSLLTYSLLQGMSGMALTPDKRVDVSTLFEFACEQVRILAKGIGGIQSPMMLPPQGGSFDIGIANENVKIPLSQVKPVFIRNNLMNEVSFFDELELSAALSEYFRRVSAKGAQSKVVFVDVDQYENAYSIRGLYRVKGDVVTVRGRLFQGKNSKGEFNVSGKTNALPALVQAIVTKVTGMVK